MLVHIDDDEYGLEVFAATVDQPSSLFAVLKQWWKDRKTYRAEVYLKPEQVREIRDRCDLILKLAKKHEGKGKK